MWCVCSDRYGDPGLCLGVTAAPGIQCERQQGIFNQDGHGSQDEGGEQVHVDVVPHTVELPGADVTAVRVGVTDLLYIILLI